MKFNNIDGIKNLLKLKSENDIDLHVQEVRKRGGQIKIGDKEYKLTDFDTSKDEILQELKKANYHDLEDMVNRMQLTYNEIMDVLHIKYFSSERVGFSLKPDIYQISDINNTLKKQFIDNVKISVDIDEKIYKTNLKINQTLIFTERFFLYNIGFTQSHSGPLGDLDGYIQLIPGTYKSERPININSIDKVHLKCDCFDGSIVNVNREPILFSLALDQPPGHEKYKEPKVKLFKKVNKSVLSHIRFYLEDDDHKEVDFNGQLISFTCQLIKI